MEKNIADAVKEYSGDKPFGLFVDKLDKNVEKLNALYAEIKDLFVSAGIEEFSQIPADMAERKKFADLFQSFNENLEAAKVQGFEWDKPIVIINEDTDEKTELHADFDERTFKVLALRYKELFTPNPDGSENDPDDDVPYAVNSYLTTIDTADIDTDYMNSRFEKYLKIFYQEGAEAEAIHQAETELHKTFATLSQEEQKYANIFLHDIQSGAVVPQPGKTLREYIAEYIAQKQNDQIHKVAEIFGLDEKKLRAFMRANITEANINEFGRFDDLKATVDKAKARALDSTTPTYTDILLQNVKTTDVCDGNAIFLIGRPESHIKNVTLDNVQISAKKGIDIRFVDNLVFKNNSKITVSSGSIWLKKFDSTWTDECDATSTGSTVTDTKGPFTLNSKTLTDKTAGSFSNGFAISNEKGKTYDTGSGTNYIKYSANQYTIIIPDGIKIVKMDIEGKDNYTDADAYLGEINGTSYDASTYVFPKDKSLKKYTVEFDSPVEHTLTFTPKVKQCILQFTLYTETSTGIQNITAIAKVDNNNIYDLSGRMVKLNAKAEDLKSLKKGIYIYNNKKYVAK